jgi:opacity protein-like surface antigen
MRFGFALFIGTTTILLAGSAQAQTSSGAAAAGYKGYVEGVAQASFGNQSSQSYGAELGYKVTKSLQVFVELGRVRTDAPSSAQTSAQTLETQLFAQRQILLSDTIKVPVSFALAGVRYPIVVKGPIEPYVMAGFGVARITKDVHFFDGGTDVTSKLSQAPYLTVLGADLSGDFNKGTLTIGAGAVYPIWNQVVIDLQYRYGRVFDGNDSMNLSRVGLGIGVRF